MNIQKIELKSAMQSNWSKMITLFFSKPNVSFQMIYRVSVESNKYLG